MHLGWPGGYDFITSVRGSAHTTTIRQLQVMHAAAPSGLSREMLVS